MPRAEANARRQATPEQWAAYRSLWDGSLPDDQSFRRAFETIRPLYFHDKALAAAANAARADTRYRIAVRQFIIAHEYATYDCRAELAAHHAAPHSSWWGVTTGSAPSTRPRRSTG